LISAVLELQSMSGPSNVQWPSKPTLRSGFVSSVFPTDTKGTEESEETDDESLRHRTEKPSVLSTVPRNTRAEPERRDRNQALEPLSDDDQKLPLMPR